MTIKVYYLDDEEALCRLFANYLASDNIELTTFIDANSAIESANQDPPDIFFIDYRLPGLTGDEVAFSVPDDIIKVLVTGDLSFNPKYEFQHIISKPYSYEVIEDVIEMFRKPGQ